MVPSPCAIAVPPSEINIYVGTYTITFDDGRFDIVQHGTKPFCSGSYTIVERPRPDGRPNAPARRSIRRRAGRTNLFLDATFELTDDGLRLSDASGHVRRPHAVHREGTSAARLTRSPKRGGRPSHAIHRAMP